MYLLILLAGTIIQCVLFDLLDFFYRSMWCGSSRWWIEGVYYGLMSWVTNLPFKFSRSLVERFHGEASADGLASLVIRKDFIDRVLRSDYEPLRSDRKHPTLDFSIEDIVISPDLQIESNPLRVLRIDVV